MIKYVMVAVSLIAMVSAGWADDIPPPKTDPVEPAAVKLVAPKEVSGTGTKLDPYIFTTSTRCILQLSEPVKGVKWDKDNAPPDTEILDDRYASFSLYKPGLFQLVAYEGMYSNVWFRIKSGTDPPTPDVDPVDPDDPDDVDPQPTVGKLMVVVVREAKQMSTWPSSQVIALMSAEVRDYCNSHCLTGADGKTPEYKVYEPDTDVSKQSPAIQKAFKTALDDMAAAKSKGPWLTISNGKTGFSGPYPTMEPEVLAKLKLYGGP